jgi:hypothetical protein
MMRLAPSEKLVLKDVTNRLAPQQLSFQSPPQKAKGTISPHSETYSDMQFAMNAALIASSCTPKTARERLARLSGLSSPDGGHTDLKKMLADQQISLEEYEIMVSRREQEKTLTPVTDLASQEFWREDTLNMSPPDAIAEQRALDFDDSNTDSPSNDQLQNTVMVQKQGAAKPFRQDANAQEGSSTVLHSSCTADVPDAGVSVWQAVAAAAAVDAVQRAVESRGPHTEAADVALNGLAAAGGEAGADAAGVTPARIWLGPETSDIGAIQVSELPDTVQKLRTKLSEIQLSRTHMVAPEAPQDTRGEDASIAAASFAQGCIQSANEETDCNDVPRERWTTVSDTVLFGKDFAQGCQIMPGDDTHEHRSPVPVDQVIAASHLRLFAPTRLGRRFATPLEHGLRSFGMWRSTQGTRIYFLLIPRCDRLPKPQQAAKPRSSGRRQRTRPPLHWPSTPSSRVSVRANPERLSTLCVFHSKYCLYGAVALACRALNGPFRRFSAHRAVDATPAAAAALPSLEHTLQPPQLWTMPSIDRSILPPPSIPRQGRHGAGAAAELLARFESLRQLVDHLPAQAAGDAGGARLRWGGGALLR